MKTIFLNEKLKNTNKIIQTISRLTFSSHYSLITTTISTKAVVKITTNQIKPTAFLYLWIFVKIQQKFYPSNKSGQRTPQHGAHVERQKTRDTGKIILGNNKILIDRPYIRMHGRKNRKCNEKHKENVVQLRLSLFKHRPIRYWSISLLVFLAPFLRLLLLLELVVSIKPLQKWLLNNKQGEKCVGTTYV